MVFTSMHVGALRRSAARIAATYAGMALVWIVFSDMAIEGMFHDAATLSHIQTLKGVLFVAITMLVMWLQITRALTRTCTSEQRYATLFETCPDAIFVVEQGGCFVDANPAALALSGYTLAELSQRSAAELLTGQVDPDTVLIAASSECQLRTKTGGLVTVEVSASSLLVGRKPATMVIVRNVSEQRAAAKALEQSEARFRALFEAAPVGIAASRQGLTLAANPAYLTLFGWESPDQLSGRPLTEQLAPAVRADVLARNQRREDGLAEPTAYETLGLRRDGSTFDLFVNVARVELGDQPLTLVFATDVSQRKATESLLQQQARRATALAEISRTLAEAGLDHQRVLTVITRQTAELVGNGSILRLLSEDRQVLELVASYHPDPEIDQLLLRMVVAAPHHITEGLNGQVVQSGQPILVPHFEPQTIMPSLRPERWSYFEQVRPHSALIVPLCVHGRIIGTLTLLRDQTAQPYTGDDQQFVQELADRAALAVENARLFRANEQELSEHKRTAAALHASEERLRLIVNNAPIALFALDCNGVITASESKGLQATVYGPGDVVGQSIFDVLETAPALLGSVRRALAGDEHMSFNAMHGYSFETHWRPIRDEQGKVSGVIGVATDVTERVQAEAERQQLVSLVEHSADIIVIASLEGNIRFMNSAAKQFFGLFDDAAVKATTVDQFFTPADYEVFLGEIVAVLRRDGRWFGEFQTKHFVSGARLPIELNAFVLYDSQTGEPIAYANVGRDISARKLAEAQLREARGREQAIIHGVGDPMFLKDRDGRYLLVNQAAAEQAGLQLAAMLGQRDHDLLPPVLAAARRAIELQVMERDQPLELEQTLERAGTEHTVLMSTTPYRDVDGTVQGVISVARDITERKKAEETLRRSEATNRALINALPDMLLRLDRDGIFLAYEPAQAGEGATDPAALVGKHLSEVTPPEVTQQALDQIELVLRTGEMQMCEYTFPLPQGGTGVYEARFVRCDHDQVLAVVRDITERKRMEQALRESEARQHGILHGTADAVFLKDRDGRYLLVNRAGAAVLQRGENEIVHKTDWELFSQAEAEAFRQDDLKVMTTRLPLEVENVVIVDGQERTFLTVKAPYCSLNGSMEGVIVVAREITERKRQEQIKDDFLALASHELKTPLAALIGYIHLLERWTSRQGMGERFEKALVAMRHEGERLDRLINDLLDVSRIQTGRLQLHIQPVDMHSYLSRVVATLQLAITDHRIVMQLPPTMARCEIDPQRMEQVLANLLTNAAKYSWEGAPIFVELSVGEQDLEIAVRDTGLGIPHADLALIFDRFYQVQRPTRESRPGLGLGLFITHEIVRQHGGSLQVESREHIGSRFAVRLPVSGSTPMEASQNAPSTVCPAS